MRILHVVILYMLFFFFKSEDLTSATSDKILNKSLIDILNYNFNVNDVMGIFENIFKNSVDDFKIEEENNEMKNLQFKKYNFDSHNYNFAYTSFQDYCKNRALSVGLKEVANSESCRKYLEKDYVTNLFKDVDKKFQSRFHKEINELKLYIIEINKLLKKRDELINEIMYSFDGIKNSKNWVNKTMTKKSSKALPIIRYFEEISYNLKHANKSLSFYDMMVQYGNELNAIIKSALVEYVYMYRQTKNYQTKLEKYMEKNTRILSKMHKKIILSIFYMISDMNKTNEKISYIINNKVNEYNEWVNYENLNYVKKLKKLKSNIDFNLDEINELIDISKEKLDDNKFSFINISKYLTFQNPSKTILSIIHILNNKFPDDINVIFLYNEEYMNIPINNNIKDYIDSCKIKIDTNNKNNFNFSHLDFVETTKYEQILQSYVNEKNNFKHVNKKKIENIMKEIFIEDEKLINDYWIKEKEFQDVKSKISYSDLNNEIKMYTDKMEKSIINIDDDYTFKPTIKRYIYSVRNLFKNAIFNFNKYIYSFEKNFDTHMNNNTGIVNITLKASNEGEEYIHKSNKENDKLEENKSLGDIITNFKHEGGQGKSEHTHQVERKNEQEGIDDEQMEGEHIYDLERELGDDLVGDLGDDMEDDLGEYLEGDFGYDLERVVNSEVANEPGEEMGSAAEMGKEVRREAENEKENKSGIDLENDLEKEMGLELENDLEKEMGLELENDLEKETGHELENDLEKETGHELENDLEKETGHELENDLEKETGHELENVVGNDLGNETAFANEETLVIDTKEKYSSAGVGDKRPAGVEEEGRGKKVDDMEADAGEGDDDGEDDGDGDHNLDRNRAEDEDGDGDDEGETQNESQDAYGEDKIGNGRGEVENGFNKEDEADGESKDEEGGSGKEDDIYGGKDDREEDRDGGEDDGEEGRDDGEDDGEEDRDDGEEDGEEDKIKYENECACGNKDVGTYENTVNEKNKNNLSVFQSPSLKYLWRIPIIKHLYNMCCEQKNECVSKKDIEDIDIYEIEQDELEEIYNDFSSLNYEESIKKIKENVFYALPDVDYIFKVIKILKESKDKNKDRNFFYNAFYGNDYLIIKSKGVNVETFIYPYFETLNLQLSEINTCTAENYYPCMKTYIRNNLIKKKINEKIVFVYLGNFKEEIFKLPKSKIVDDLKKAHLKQFLDSPKEYQFFNNFLINKYEQEYNFFQKLKIYTVYHSKYKDTIMYGIDFNFYVSYFSKEDLQHFPLSYYHDSIIYFKVVLATSKYGYQEIVPIDDEIIKFGLMLSLDNKNKNVHYLILCEVTEDTNYDLIKSKKGVVKVYEVSYENLKMQLINKKYKVQITKNMKIILQKEVTFNNNNKRTHDYIDTFYDKMNKIMKNNMNLELFGKTFFVHLQKR
ncbi:hypothetical protein POVWA2_028060 [Plasmodium ovale wallikeri]|uniref:Uncharacterized protein n=1 Tax=Plasmodium ovale wallikeri TaxID=864142 RepID=A0A1A8YX66_PLAOA|nr:hypothetical protein POVWA2_028060 [Plasmodium ovale wallikeri]